MIKFNLLPLLFIALLSGCNKHSMPQNQQNLGSSLSLMNEDSSEEASNFNIIKVVDTLGRPVAGAQVLLGQSLSQPFADNFITTNSQGLFQAPAAWNQPIAVTIDAPGFLRVTYFAQLPQGQVFQLRAADKPKEFELKGTATGFKVVDRDDKADFALIMPLMKKIDLFGFDAAKVVSPEVDIMEVVGQKIRIPSNVSIPTQKERYTLITVTMDKPAYRMYFENMGPQWVFAAKGQFPFSKVVNEMQGDKQFFELINYFSIQGGGLRNPNIAAPTQNLNIPVTELVFNQARDFKAPAFPATQTLLVVPVSPFQNAFFPTDLKNLSANQAAKLMTAAGASPQVLAILQNKPDKNGKLDLRMSVSFTDFAANMTPQLLPIMNTLSVVNTNLVKLQPVSKPNFVAGSGTYSVLSKVEKRVRNGVTIEEVFRLWEVYQANSWLTEIQTPVWPEDENITGKKRWEVIYVGSPDPVLSAGPMMLEKATHATRAQADF